MAENDRVGQAVDRVVMVRHSVLTILRNLGLSALGSHGVLWFLHSVLSIDSGSTITLYVLLLFVAPGLAVVLGLKRPLVEDESGRIRGRWGCYLLSFVGIVYYCLVAAWLAFVAIFWHWGM